ncbi:hypothetical protein ABPG72_018054 [Tetrahymena utriculariae]
MGIELSECEQLLLHSGDLFQASLGGIRLKAVLEDLEMLNSDLMFRCMDTFIETEDKIKILSKKLDLSAERIKYVIDERQKKLQQIYLKIAWKVMCQNIYQVYIIDVNKADILYDRRCVSLYVLSLLGIEPSDFKQIILHQGNGFQSTFGKDRMKSLLEMLDIFVNDNNNKFLEASLKSFDKINIPIKELVEVVFWEGRPKWASKFDYVLMFAKFDLPAEQIKQVIEIRQNKEKLDIPDIVESFTFDYIIQSEIFLEKFYPKQKLKNLSQKQNQLEETLE